MCHVWREARGKEGAGIRFCPGIRMAMAPAADIAITSPIDTATVNTTARHTDPQSRPSARGIARPPRINFQTATIR